MAELVRPKKPRHKNPSSQQQEEVVAPPIPTRSAVVQGHRLPEVPRHALRQRSVSPEPEEQVLSDAEEENIPPIKEKEPDSPAPARPAPPRPQSSSMDTVRTPPPLPPRNAVFPRSVSMQPATESTIETPTPLSMTAPSAATTTRPAIPNVRYPVLPELAELPAYAAALDMPPPYVATQPAYPMLHSNSAGALPEKMRPSEASTSALRTRTAIAEAPPMYPSVSNLVFERNQHGLMTEANLLAFYHNVFYEAVDDFADQFVRENQLPNESGPLFLLLKRLRELCDQMTISQINDKENTEALQLCLRECWSIEQKFVEAKGVCNEGREGSGRASYQCAVANKQRQDELRKLLAANRNNLLDHTLSEETTFRSIALQIQWEVIIINNRFMSENQLNVQSAPFLVESAVSTPSRATLLRALADLFYHLRFPRLPKRFSDTVVLWISELICVLNMKQTCNDGIFVLSHLLRIPSPNAEWSAPLVQTFIQAPSPPKLKIDYCLAMLAHLMNPIKARENFLRHVAQSEKEESAWAILGDDLDEGDEFSFVAINELDLTALFDQLPVSELYSIAYMTFSSSSVDKNAQFISLVAFQLLYMKVLDTGLSAYSRPGFKMFCKQIGNSLRQSVRELCAHWKMTKNSLTAGEEANLQKEVDRIALLAVGYLINRESAGMWQFMVDLPYSSVSEECRLRCEYVIRSPKKVNIHELYETPICEVQARNKSMGLKARAEALGAQDAVFLVNALAAIAAHSLADAAPLIRELVDVCFCDDSSRETLYKVGGEAIGQLLARRPNALDQLVSIIDRNLQHMDSYAINVLASSQLFECRLSQPILCILGKWLINYAPEHGANRLARRVLSSLHWGPTSDGQTLWIDADVHAICAETVVKAHSVHCTRSNGMIAKSMRQITKLASKVGDSENVFQQFCWDILIKLKISSKSQDASAAVQNDLTAHYVQIVQKYEETVPLYLEKAVPLLADLVASGSAAASVVLLSRFVARHHSQSAAFAGNKAFLDTFEKLLHVDQLSYAVQWLAGPSSTPTPIVRLVCSAISYYSGRVNNMQDYLRAWIDLLCVKRTGWNEDQVTYQIVGTVVRIAFIHDPRHLFGITDMLQNVYTQQLAAAKEANRGLLSMFSSEAPPPPLVPTSMLGVAPFATFVMLLVERDTFATFYAHLYEALAKKEKTTLDAAVKKAGSKTSMAIPLLRLSVYRWAEFVDHCKDSYVLPLALQQLVIDAYAFRKTQKTTSCFARRYIDAPGAEPQMRALKMALDTASVETRGLARAVSGWLFCTHDVTKKGFNFSVFDLDFLLQLSLAGDKNIWMDFVNVVDMNSEEFSEQKLYSTACHLTIKERLNTSMSVEMPRGRSVALGFPALPKHPGLPQAPAVEPSLLFQHHAVTQLASPYLKTINKLAEQYVGGSDKIAAEDASYCELLTNLYLAVQQTIPIQIRCGVRCQQHRDSTVQAHPLVFNSGIDAQMTVNREKRAAAWNEVSAVVTDKAAVAVATVEHLARHLARLAAICQPANRGAAQLTGRKFFYLMTSSVGDSEMLFSAAADAYLYSLRALAEEFVRCRPEEQLEVMKLVLDGFVLSDPLIESFTPEVLSANDLCAAYTRLSESVRQPERSQRALQLLGRLGMEKAAAGLPAHQFNQLLPIAFANLASQPDPAASLHVLCLQHVVFFVFHQFPSNLTAGLELALDGCNSNSTPSSLLQILVDQLGANEFGAASSKSEFALGAAKAKECAMVMTSKLNEARQRLPAMYSVWGRYVDPITRLAQLFLFVPTRDGFQSSLPIYALQNDLNECFTRIVGLFSPLIAPATPTQPPFLPSHDAEASLVLERFVELLTSLPHNAAIPPGMQNVQSLVWQYYFERLSTLSHATVHYYEVVERQLVRLNWQSLWPSPRGLAAMDECLRLRSADCASFVAQMVVRAPWNDIIATQVPEADRPEYLANLVSVLARLVARPANYTKVRASLLQLVKTLSSRGDLATTTPTLAERLSPVVATSLPADALANPVDVVAVIQIIWRKMCCISPREPFSPPTLAKQATWLRTECALLLKCPSTGARAAYNSLISDINAIAVQHSNLRAFCAVARELTAMWANISDVGFGEAVLEVWSEYLAANANSPLVLTSMHTLIASLNADQLTTALKVLEKTFYAYFHRAEASWAELVEWVQFPSPSHAAIHSYLLCVPTSENKVQALMLTLRVFLDCGLHSDKVFFDLHNYVISLKPKHVTNEAAFVVVIARLLEWMTKRAPSLPASFAATDDLFPPLIRWLNKSSRDESGFFTNLISSKKTSHSLALRVLFQIVELFLTQQTLGEGRRPRCDPNSPVINSRIQALRDLASAKANQPLSAVFNVATAFFVQADVHAIGSAHRLLLVAGKAAFDERFLQALL